MKKRLALYLSFAGGCLTSLIIFSLPLLFCSYWYPASHQEIKIFPENIENSNAQTLDSNSDFSMKYIDTKQISLTEIASYTAAGDIQKLETALGKALDAGMTVNEIKETLLHVYAYAGFPRSLNGMGALQRVLEARTEAGIIDTNGTEAEEVQNIDKFVEGGKVQTELVGMSFNYTFVPGMDVFLKEHLFADLFLRGVLSYQERELVTIAALSALDGAESQLGSHLRMGMNTGLTSDQVKEVVNYVSSNLGVDRSALLENL